jgi:hypothetical protein
MLSPTQIQRMCTNYYVADYEVLAVLSPNPKPKNTDTLHRTRFRLRSCVLSQPESRLTTAMTIYSLLQRPRRSTLMSYPSREKSLAWRPTYPHILMFRISDAWPPLWLRKPYYFFRLFLDCFVFLQLGILTGIDIDIIRNKVTTFL